MQQRSEETRARILTAAQQVFARGGYDATPVDAICQAAGVSKGAFYHHFPSKQAVFLCLLENWLADLEPRLAELSSGAGDVPAALVRMSALFDHIFASGSGQLPMFLEFWVQSSRDPLVWQATIAPYHRFQALFAAILQTGIDHTDFRRVDSQTASRVLMALAIGLIVQGLFDPTAADWPSVGREGIQILADGLRRSP